MSDDLILVEKINELETRLKLADEIIEDQRKRLRHPIRIIKSFQDLWTWWWKTEERQMLTILPTIAAIIGLGIAWGIGGWASDHFYIDYDNGTAYIYQELDWGKDRKVDSCYAKNMGECVSILKAQEASWQVYKGTQDEQ